MECTNCGNCCTPCLQMTQEEIDTIKQYIIDNNIPERLYYIEGKLEYVCPFRNREDKICNIYEVRPEVCRLFESWTEGYGVEGHVQRLIDTNVSTCKAHELFFGNTTFYEDYKNENE